MRSQTVMAHTCSMVLGVWLMSLGFSDAPAEAVLIHDEPSGFRGNHWGDAPGSCPSLRFVKGLGTTQTGMQVDLYDRSTVGIILNGVSFSRIRYRFLDNQLESVQLSFEGREGYTRLMQLMEQRYGALTAGERQMPHRAEWLGFESSVILTFEPGRNAGSLWFFSTALTRDFNWPG